MKSLLVSCISPKMSGGEIYSLQLLKALQSKGWEVSILGNKNSYLEQAAFRNHVRFIESDVGPKLGRKTAVSVIRRWRSNNAKLFRIIEQENPTVVLFQYKLEQLLWAGKPLGRTVVMLEHGPIPAIIRKVPLFRARYAAAVRAADIRFGASQPAVNAISSWGVPAELLSAGLDLTTQQRAVEATPETRQRLTELLPNCTKIGFYAGRLTEAKGILHAAQAIAEVPDIGLVIAGSGPCSDELELLAQRCTNIVLLGQLEDSLPYAAASDFGILLTNDPGEGRPLFALECASFGIPVIANQNSAAMRALHSELGGQAIVLINTGDPSSLSSAVNHVHKFPPILFDWNDAADVFESSVASARSNRC